ncbi:HPr family phosphocarrier protein [Nonomuraea sp. NBC_01738]|uniref:HPr family phosphocarrier protein n=1 Tax=Nonomuraea sp. NBC_01738 TaxID=2976003 RepID=UPI002E13B223|nr:HPr family phosphocarrier protein [Nonomuraea sp. NBC_01738]
MPERTVAIASRSGLHARPAKIFVQAAQRLGIPVRISVGAKNVLATSMLGVLSLGATHGTVVTLSSDSDAALDELTAVLARDLDDE